MELRHYRGFGLMSLVAILVLILALACGAEDTPVRRAAPTVAPAPTAAPAPTPAPAPTARPIPTAAPTGPTYGGTLRWGEFRGFDTLDPAYSLWTGTRPVNFALYGNLVEVKSDGTIAPDLARSWEVSEGGKNITFTLHKGIRFHDGTPLDAQAVKWNFDRYMDPDVGSSHRGTLSPPLERVEVVDSERVRFHLSHAWRPFLNQLGYIAGFIASPTAVQKMASYDDRGGAFGSNPVGAGMFKFEEWLPGNKMVLVRNDDYFDSNLPYLDGIQALEIPDTRLMFAMLRTGEMEVVANMSPGDAILARGNPSIKTVMNEGMRGRVLYFKATLPPWDNKLLRQAFAYAMDRQAIINVMYNGFAAEKAYSSLYSSLGVWHDPTFRMFEYDPKMGRQKLAEAGYPDGFTYTQPCRGSTWEMEFCEVAQVMLADVGIDMQIQGWEPSSYYGDWVAGKYDAPTWAGYSSRGEPDLTLRRFLHSGGAGNKGRANYSNTEFDRLLDKAAIVYDVAEAKKIYRQALEVVVEEAPIVYQIAEHTLYGVNAQVRDFALPPDNEVRLRALWLDR